MNKILDSKLIVYTEGIIKISTIEHIGIVFTQPQYGKGWKLLINDKYALTFDSQAEGNEFKKELQALLLTI